MFRSITIIGLALSLAAGCAPATDSLDSELPDETGARVVEGSAQALGMLEFLNDGRTTFDTLDVVVGLDRRAALSIIAYRNGPDGVFDTPDDKSFDSVVQVDDQYYVGSSALNRIEKYASDNGWVALGPDDELGTFDGVTFTVAEAAAVVELANTAGQNYLDDDLGLDRRAVLSIVDARPIENIAVLSDLYYVGKSAMTTLKEESAGLSGCTVDGWETEYVYADDSGEWRNTLNSDLVEVIDDVTGVNDWCGNAYGDSWFVKATVDRFNCEEKGYTIELGQLVDEFHGLSWYIEFEVDAEFSYNGAVCEI